MARRPGFSLCQFFRAPPSTLAAALALVGQVLRRGPGGRRRTRLGLDSGRFPALGDVLHLLVDEQAVGVALAVRRRQLPRAGDLDLVADLVGRTGRLLGILGIAAIGRRVAQLVLG